MKLLIADVMLHRTSGPQIARRLRELRPGLNDLYNSGYGEHAMVNQGVLESGAPFMQKPILPSALLRRVRSLLSEPEAFAVRDCSLQGVATRPISGAEMFARPA